MNDHKLIQVGSLLERLTKEANEDFTGVGLIFYFKPVDRISVYALGDERLFTPALPISGLDFIVKTLLNISKIESDWHDGFHLIDIEKFELTHICQFVVPPINVIDSIVSGKLPIGARRKVAISMSNLSSVFCSAQIHSDRRQRLFKNGKQINITENNWRM